MRIAIECTADAVVRERWTLEVSAEEYKRIKNDPDAAMDMLDGAGERIVGVENLDVSDERDREFVSIERVTEHAS